MLKRLAAVLLVGATYFAAAVAWPSPGYAQVVSSRQAVCDPQYPTRCIKPAADGSIAVTGGGGGGGAAATASAAALPVVAGTDKPQNIDLFSQTRVLVGDTSGNPIDWTAAVPITGVNGTSVATAANPFPISGPVVVTADGTSTTGIAPASSTAAESCRVLKASPGNVYSVSGYIGAAGFLMLFDATSAPADGAVTPKAWAYASAAGSWSMSYGSVPAVMATGITICASSTGPLTKTAYSTNTVFSGNVK